jgi:uncharacterized protein
MFEDARAAGRQVRSLRRIAHRPFPLSNSRWTLGQTWEQTFWAHWPVPVGEVRARVPDELEIEEHDGSAWVSIVFFRVRALRARGALPVPGISSFLQLNIRTYVCGPDGLPGVWFFSIDASSRLAALGVRRIYRVPAYHARMTLEPVEDWQEVECVRIGEPGRVFSARYRPTGETFHPEPGSLEWFLTERYRLFTGDGRAEIHHDRWLLSPAEAEIELASIAPLTLAGPPRCHFAFRQDTLIWPPERI